MDELEEKFSDYSDVNLDELIVFIRYKQDPGTQYWIKFKNSYDNFNVMNITSFKRFKKDKEFSEKVSLFGNDNNRIVYLIVKDFIINLVPTSECYEFIIGIDTELPDSTDCLNFLVNKTDINMSCDRECPVCKDEYKQNEAVRLNCGHKVCRDCLLRIFETGRVNCPMCRTPICRPPENEDDTLNFMNA